MQIFKVVFHVDWNYPDNPVWGLIEAPGENAAAEGMRTVLAQTYLEPEGSFKLIKIEEASEDDLAELRQFRFPEYGGAVWL